MNANPILDQQRQLVRDFAAADKTRAARENAAHKQHAASETTAQQQYATAEKAAQQEHAAAEQQTANQRWNAKSQLDSAAASIGAARSRVATDLAAMQVHDVLPSLTAAKALAPFSALNEKPLPQFVNAATHIVKLSGAVAQTYGQWQHERQRRRTTWIVAGVTAAILIAVGVYLFQQWSYNQRLAGIYQTGKAALEAGEWQSARDQFNNVLALEPGYQDAQTLIYESYYQAGKAALEAGEWQSARDQFNNVLALEPGYRDAQTLIYESYYRPGKAALEAGEWENARDDFNELVRLEPGYHDAQTLLNQVVKEMGLFINPKDDAIYVYIPAGEFSMGSPKGQGRDDERPQHAVTLDAFWIMQTEVTNGQYAQCVADGACSPPNNSRWQESQYAGHPIVNVTWQQAYDYAAWAGGRLPTEAEWEKACRGSDGRAYPWGEDEPNTDLLNFNQNVGGTTPVGSYPAGASPFGALDMAGNVWEWTADWYAPNYYSQSPAGNPTGPASGEYRVLRSGSFYNDATAVGCASRDWYAPYFRDVYFGFRVASPGF